MTNLLTNLRGSLEKAVIMIDESLLLPIEESIHLDSLGSPKRELDFTHATSLLDKCADVNEQYLDSKPVIRLIHHFACSGGTLVSKCLSVMPNVFLLSEVHPHSDLQKDKETPTVSFGLISSSSASTGEVRRSNTLTIETLSETLFMLDATTCGSNLVLSNSNLIVTNTVSVFEKYFF